MRCSKNWGNAVGRSSEPVVDGVCLVIPAINNLESAALLDERVLVFRAQRA